MNKKLEIFLKKCVKCSLGIYAKEILQAFIKKDSDVICLKKLYTEKVVDKIQKMINFIKKSKSKMLKSFFNFPER